ncbi:hypothetical protein EZJ43_09430 [Pedobacter changchengzhani]|uniref:Uncharacterized protein n=1 Tax=Pedobacter changchengzhani TaxID=2529274 RepID=A0A4R5MKL9_9SPHI|nr:glycoside hydrolase N-terminal domain-containing protein [Pedobacter changchengzhani]TDG36214.1 hypothetical protein EZJ43_09430 [Pedobacter changchengzhani]
MKKIANFIVCFFFIFFGNTSFVLGQKLASPERGFISSKPGKNWEEGLISGNGTIGVNVLSKPLNDIIIFSHAKLFLPIRNPVMPPDNGARIWEIRNLIDRGLYKQATELAAQFSGQEDFYGPDPFVPAFDMNINMSVAGLVKDYVRAVNFETGEAKVQWVDDRGRFERKIFASRADSLVVLELTGPKGALNFSFNLNSTKPDSSLGKETLKYSENNFKEYISNVKQQVNQNTFIYSNSFSKAYPGSVHALEGIAEVVYNNGALAQDGNSIKISGADRVLIFINIGLLYNPAKSQQTTITNKMSALSTDYDVLVKRHAAIHGKIFNRMKLDLGGGQDRKLTSEELINKSSVENTNMALIEKEFDAGRYNILSCMGDRPPALGGIWGGTYSPAWSGDYTHNGNVPSAISSVLMGNMPELMSAYTNYMESITHYLEINAKNMFGARGIVLPSRSSTTAFNNALANDFAGGFWVAGAAWASHYFYDYYRYTGDKKFLKEHALPFMEKSVLFFEDYLYLGPDGKYIFSPTQSPENTPKNSDSQGSFNATMDMAAASELIHNTIIASQIAGVNADKIDKWKAMLKKMPDYMLTDNGIIKEWLTPKLDNNDDHRHSSQLYALYDGIPAEIENSPRLMTAFKKSIEQKLTAHWRNNKVSEMSFGIVQLGQASASLGEKELAYECLRYLVNRFWLGNMASMHNYRRLFNMDVSGGMPSVMIKMLAFADDGRLKILPALPTELSKGSIEGVLCRGQIEIEKLSWDQKSITVKMKSQIDQTISLVLPSTIKNITSKNNAVDIKADKDNSKRIHLPAMKTVELNINLK